jgi:hypothetical protein
MHSFGHAAPLANAMRACVVCTCTCWPLHTLHPDYPLPCRHVRAQRSVLRSVRCAIALCCCYYHTQETELVAAGFPCIDVSRAGLRQGLEGPVSEEQRSRVETTPISTLLACQS